MKSETKEDSRVDVYVEYRLGTRYLCKNAIKKHNFLYTRARISCVYLQADFIYYVFCVPDNQTYFVYTIRIYTFCAALA